MVKRLQRRQFQVLFDYQRFQQNTDLGALIEQTDQRYLAGSEAFTRLSDEAISAVYGAGDTQTPSLCPYCGAVLPGVEALQQHIANRHPSL